MKRVHYHQNYYHFCDQTAEAAPLTQQNLAKTGVYGKYGAGEGNRTLVFSLEGCCSTIELHPHQAS
jgi:hypothetical protein